MDRGDIEAIENLEKLQKRIPRLEDLVAAIDGSFVQYEMERGFAVGRGCLWDHECAVQKYFATGGTFTEHTHEEWEYFIVLEGTGRVFLDEEAREFGPHDCIVIEPETAHRWEYDTPVKMIAATVPASRGYPNGPG